MSYEIHNGTMYTMDNGCRLGVALNKVAMLKVLKLQQEYNEKLRTIICDQAAEGNARRYMWTLHYPEGEQKTVYYLDTSKQECIDDHIKRIFVASAPQKIEAPLFIAGSMDEASLMADARHHEAGGEP